MNETGCCDAVPTVPLLDPLADPSYGWMVSSLQNGYYRTARKHALRRWRERPMDLRRTTELGLALLGPAGRFALETRRGLLRRDLGISIIALCIAWNT